jgi:hypothetical protein
MKYVELGKAIEKTSKLITLTENKLALLKQLQASLLDAKRKGMCPENLIPAQLEFNFSEE